MRELKTTIVSVSIFVTNSSTGVMLKSFTQFFDLVEWAIAAHGMYESIQT
jgi:flagellar biosynthesis regulator FlaF